MQTVVLSESRVDMSVPPEPQHRRAEVSDAEIDLRGLLEAIRRAWRLIAIATVICAALALGAAYLTPNKYEAQVVLALVSDEIGANSGGASELGDYGGLASLVGLSVPNSGDKAIALATLQSSGLSARFIQSRGLLSALFSPVRGLSIHNLFVSDKRPTMWEATAYFDKKIRSVEQDKRTGMVSLTITWRDPQAAASWANEYVSEANDVLKSRAIAESEKNIAYLNAQAEKSNVVEMRQSIYTLLRLEIRKAMLAQGSNEYALRVVDPAVAPEKPASPLPWLWCLIGGAIGMLGAAFWVVVRSSF
jgi:uncharacterized protein involved in exopolysaccharide biosynthesis